MSVETVSSLMSLEASINKADANRLFVIDFYADWCGPCRFIAPFFEQLAGQYRNATFFKVNVDNSPDISGKYGVRAMPTFVLIKNKKEVDRVQGASQDGIKQAVERHYSSTPANPNAANDEEKRFLERFVSYTRQAKIYGDVVYKQLARSVVPEDKITKAATRNDIVDRFVLLEELMNWFKNEFFKWCDAPVCNKCGTQAEKGRGLNGTPTREEQEFDAHRVEVYECKKCGEEVRFPRFNNPAKLLETRTGRCGEWANCFTLIASAMGFEVRYILDTTDHVWTEVYLKDQKRWVHCDPCENIIDQPLIYEKGWGKQLSYVIAYGFDHVYDVTWRYVINSRNAYQLRPVRSVVFSSFISKLHQRQSAHLSNSEKKSLVLQRLCELIDSLAFELNKPKILASGKFGGRSSGSHEWRESRGELGSANGNEFEHVIKLPETKEKKAIFSYNCATDSYDNFNNKEEGFRTIAYECKNIIRKVEHDWKKVYLCRKDGDKDGTISWNFDLSSRTISKIEIQVNGMEEFEGGKVMAVACLGETCMKIPKTGKLEIESPESDQLKVSATLTGGSGASAFQHAQLFRGSSDEMENIGLKVIVEYN